MKEDKEAKNYSRSCGVCKQQITTVLCKACDFHRDRGHRVGCPVDDSHLHRKCK